LFQRGVLPDTGGMRRFLALLLTLGLAGCGPADSPGSTRDVHTLAERGETAPLLAALATGDSVDRRDACYRTPLMFAAQFGHADTVRDLLAAGARPNLHEKGYYTALMLAAGNGHTEVVRLLAEAGASVDEVEITHRWTALIWASKRGHQETVELLLGLGADRSARDDQGWTARDWALAQGHEAVAALL
jgi:ankyrin repeat protein